MDESDKIAKEQIESEVDQERADWHQFVSEMYGCMADAPIELFPGSGSQKAGFAGTLTPRPPLPPALPVPRARGRRRPKLKK